MKRVMDRKIVAEPPKAPPQKTDPVLKELKAIGGELYLLRLMQKQANGYLWWCHTAAIIFCLPFILAALIGAVILFLYSTG